MKTKIKHAAPQGEFLTCGNCGRTWPDIDAQAKLAARSGHSPYCITCALLTTIHGHCHTEHVSLQDAVGRYLEGLERRTQMTKKNIWTASDDGFHIILGVKTRK